MSVMQLLLLLPMFVLLGWSVVTDLRERRIPNRLTFLLAAGGVATAVLPFSAISPVQSAAGLGVGFALAFVVFLLGGRGGGDVKLLAAVGAWIGPWPVAAVFAVAAVYSIVYVLLQTLFAGRVIALLRSSTLLATNAIVMRQGTKSDIEHARAGIGELPPLPHAVPLAAAVVTVVAFV